MASLDEIYAEFPSAPAAYELSAASDTLQKLYSAAVRHAEFRIRNFDDRALGVSQSAKIIRSLSVILFVLGTAAPVLQAFIEQVRAFGGATAATKVPLSEVGYVLLVMAGGFVIYDKFFDQTGTWIRFRQTQARLQLLLAQFRYTWVCELGSLAGHPKRPEDFAACIRLIGSFTAQIEGVAETETNEWATRFRSRIDAFDNQSSLKVPDFGGDQPPPAPKPNTPAGAEGGVADTGWAAPAPPAEMATVSLRAVVDQAEDLDPGSLVLTLDGAQVPVSETGEAELTLTVDAAHLIEATGTMEGKPYRFTDTQTGSLEADGEAYPIALTPVTTP